MAGGPNGSQGGLVKGARITGDQRSSLAAVFGDRYAGGESIRSIASDTGRSYGFVHGVLKESGASLRGRGGATRGPRRDAADAVPDPVDGATLSPASPARTKAKAVKSAKKSSKALKDDKPGKKPAAKKSDAKKSAKKAGKKG